ncbi:VOC family protein [Janibacter cremeus]|uniref:PhnB protein n=1 Tax=Janibacter cremeus TaxID=1285192 RepID=A0A852VP86_9MICO|nr:VOC family protein [Janibacter cremeus]NYF98837.1 PhnB protein [Janibacter cremeus]
MNDIQVSPKLVVRDATAAIAFMVDVLDATEGPVHRHAGTVQHATVHVAGRALSLKDADEHDPVPSPGAIIEVVCADPDAVAERALAQGADVVFPVDDQPYGARAGRLVDPWGTQWLVTTPVAPT